MDSQSVLSGDELYRESFCRNIGILTEAEQETLKNSCVTIAGMGGVGGIYLVTLARSGIGRFIISDPDTFEYKNLNRQYGAAVDTIGKNKARVMKKIAESINPGVKIKVIEGGITPGTINEFIEGSDLVVDAIDVFNLEIKNLVHTAARKKGLYSLRAVPMGFGASMQVFSPAGMSFADYFKLTRGKDIKRIYQDVLHGHSPSRIHERYMGPGAYNILDTDGGFKAPPSICPGVNLAAALVTSEVILILLKKRIPPVAPHCIQVDMYEQVFDVSEAI